MISTLVIRNINLNISYLKRVVPSVSSFSWMCSCLKYVDINVSYLKYIDFCTPYFQCAYHNASYKFEDSYLKHSDVNASQLMCVGVVWDQST